MTVFDICTSVGNWRLKKYQLLNKILKDLSSISGLPSEKKDPFHTQMLISVVLYDCKSLDQRLR